MVVFEQSSENRFLFKRFFSHFINSVILQQDPSNILKPKVVVRVQDEDNVAMYKSCNFIFNLVHKMHFLFPQISNKF